MMGSAGTANQLVALLTALSDPKATKALLDKVSKETARMNNAAKEAREVAAKLEGKEKDDQVREAALGQREQAVAAAEDNIQKAGKQLSYERVSFESRRDAETSQIQADRRTFTTQCEVALKDIEDQRKTLNAEKREHETWRKSTQAAHDDTEKKHAAIGQALTSREKALAAAEADLARRLELLRSAAA